MKKIFLILFVLLIAGCTGNSNTGSNPNQGIIIESLTISPNDITEKEPFDIFFKVSNVGGKTTKVTPYLYGADWLNEDDLKSRELISPNKQTGSIGESYVYEKTFNEPVEVVKGLIDEYTITGRICYPYTTSAATDVEIISLTEKRQTNAKQASKTVKTDNTDAPIHIEFTIKEPLIDYGDDESELVPIAVKLKDVGGGFATNTDECTKNPEIENTDKVHISLTGTDIEDCEDTLRLVNGQATLFCKLDATTNNLPSRTIRITAEATYNYYKTKTATLKISGVS
ncbi:hypothetical protein GQ473_06005 [archaeon]|nr:hypothetical protein [archaeon]